MSLLCRAARSETELQRPSIFGSDGFVECAGDSFAEKAIVGRHNPIREHVQIADHSVHFRRYCSEPEIEELNACGDGLGLPTGHKAQPEKMFATEAAFHEKRSKQNRLGS